MLARAGEDAVAVDVDLIRSPVVDLVEVPVLLVGQRAEAFRTLDS